MGYSATAAAAAATEAGWDKYRMAAADN